jgi:hypothetical protein
MTVTTPRTWQDLTRVVSEGQDSEKLMELIGKLNLLTLARQGKPSRCGDVIGHAIRASPGGLLYRFTTLFAGIARRNVIAHESIQLMGSPPFDNPFI